MHLVEGHCPADQVECGWVVPGTGHERGIFTMGLRERVWPTLTLPLPKLSQATVGETLGSFQQTISGICRNVLPLVGPAALLSHHDLADAPHRQVLPVDGTYIPTQNHAIRVRTSFRQAPSAQCLNVQVGATTDRTLHAVCDPVPNGRPGAI